MMALLSKVNKLDLNLTIMLLYLIYLFSNNMSSKSYKVLLVPSALLVSFIPMISDCYLTTNLSDLSLIPQDISLSNGAVIIHPLMILVCYSTILYLGTIASNLDKYNQHISNKKIITKYLLNLKIYSLLYTRLIILAIALGAYWAHQELNWGGYWSWDIIEVISLSLLAILLCIGHRSNLSTLSTLSCIILHLTLSLFLIVRLGVIQSVHGFLPVQSNMININYFISYFVITTLLLMILLKSNIVPTITYLRYPKPTSYMLHLILVVTYLVILYPLITSLSAMLLDNFTSIKNRWFISITIVLVLLYLTNRWSSLSILLPISESVFLSNFISYKSASFFFKLYHFLIVLLIYFFMFLSHTYIVYNTPYDFIKNINTLVKASSIQLTNSIPISNSYLGSYPYEITFISDTYSYNYYLSYSSNQFSDIITSQSLLSSTIDKSIILEFLLHKMGWTIPIFVVSSLLTILFITLNRRRRLELIY